MLQVDLPRFKVESSFELSASLKKLGLPNLFDDTDLSGIAGARGELRVSKVLHKAFIEVGNDVFVWTAL